MLHEKNKEEYGNEQAKPPKRGFFGGFIIKKSEELYFLISGAVLSGFLTFAIYVKIQWLANDFYCGPDWNSKYCENNPPIFLDTFLPIIISLIVAIIFYFILKRKSIHFATGILLGALLFYLLPLALVSLCFMFPCLRPTF